MALALYRKYRPRTFTEVIGQEHVTEPIMQALRSGRLHHAYLFSGPRGCGKTSSARILARSLNCDKGPTPEPCGECESCQALAPDGPGSIDVIEIDAASHGGVDDARELRERAFFAPVASRFKVYIIDEAHMVSPQGFNALLKLVEEPPDYVKFIFATTEPERVLGTIRSRTHHYPFRLIPPRVLRPYLEKLCREEGVSVEPAVFALVVRAGGGSVRDSLSILDQLIAGAGVYGVTYSRAVGLLGVTDIALIDEMTDALAVGDGAAAFATVDRVVEAGHDPRRYAGDLLERLRDLIVLQRVPDAAASGIIDAPDDQLERMTAQAARMGQATLSRMADIAHDGLTEMRGTTAPRLLLELIIARMLLPGADDSTGALLQRLERMERRLGAGTGSGETDAAGGSARTLPDAAGAEVDEPDSAPALAGTPAAGGPAALGPAENRPAEARPAAPRAATKRPARSATPMDEATPQSGSPQMPPPSAPSSAPPSSGPPAGLANPGALDAAAVRRVWDEVLAVIRRRSPKAWAVVREASVRDVAGEDLVLVFQHAVHANMFEAQPELLLEALREVIGGAWRVRAELAGSPARPATRPGQAQGAAGTSTAGGRGRAAEGDSDDDGDPDDDDGWPATATPGAPNAGAATPNTPTAGAARQGNPTASSVTRPRPNPAATTAAEVDATLLPAGRVDDSARYDDDAANSVAIDDPPAEQAIQLLTEGLGAQRIAGPAG